MTVLDTTPEHKMTPIGLLLPEGTTPLEHQQIGTLLMRQQRAFQWAVGDWGAFGEAKFRQTYEQMQSILGVEYQTFANWVYVAKAIPFSRRREKLSWALHAEIAALPEPAQERWLRDAEHGQMTVAEIRVAVRQERERATPKPAMPAMPSTGGETIGRGLQVGPRNETMIAAARRGMEQEQKRTGETAKHFAQEAPATRTEVQSAVGLVRAAVQEAGEEAAARNQQLAAVNSTVSITPDAAEKLVRLVAEWNRRNPGNPHDLNSYVVSLIDRDILRVFGA